ncbi:MAG: site-specific DNA-methyltransferase [Chromatiales bacterium]|nr:site-specific DNA-methyltransferase [Chromatiales bacterium]
MPLTKARMGKPVQESLFDLPKPTSAHEMKAARSARSGTFTDNMKLPVHRWFRYSAGFSAEWAEKLISDTNPSCVLDPFAGSGTTLLAAEAAGVLAFGYESHPFVARIARAKTYWNQPEQILLEAKSALLNEAARIVSLQAVDVVPALLAKCYVPEVLQKLFALRDAYQTCAERYDKEISELLWLAITAILRSCSFVGTAQWQYVLPSKRKSKPLDPFAAFEQKVADMAADMVVLRNSGFRSDARILLHDARMIPLDVPCNSVDLVVTSPPYPNNYDYADATRLEMTFWGEVKGWSDLQETVRQYIIRSCSQHATAEKLHLETLLADSSVDSIRDELAEVCNELASVRLSKGGKKAYHTMVAAYFCDLSKVFQSLRTVCKPGSTLYFVVGDSAPYGVYVPADKWLGRLAVAAGFKSFSFEKLRDRNVKWKNRKHRVPLHEGHLQIEG